MTYTELRAGIMMGVAADRPPGSQMPNGVVYIVPMVGATPTAIYISSKGTWIRLI